jgi:hypothetical protein
MSTLWYYAQDNEQHGPLASAELRDLLQRGKLSGSTLVWSEGMASWVSADKVEDLQGAAPPVLPPRPHPANAEQPAVEANGFGHAGPPVGDIPPSSVGEGPRSPFRVQAPDRDAAAGRSRQAWSRFFARSMDIFIANGIIAIVMQVDLVNGQTSLLFPILTLLGLIPIEAFFLSRWGMTPGKWMFRVRVVHQENRLLTFQEAMTRTFRVVLSGMGLGLPLLMQLFQVLAYKELVDVGNTPWDRLYHCHVQHAPMRSQHKVVAIATALLLVLVLSALAETPAV